MEEGLKKVSFLESSAVWKSEITDLCSIPKEWGVGHRNSPPGIPMTYEGDCVDSGLLILVLFFKLNFIFFWILMCKFLESTKKYGRHQIPCRSVANELERLSCRQSKGPEVMILSQEVTLLYSFEERNLFGCACFTEIPLQTSLSFRFLIIKLLIFMCFLQVAS